MKVFTQQAIQLSALGRLIVDRASSGCRRAERAYRTLLLQVRRAPSEDEKEFPLGPCEVLIELSRIARERGQSDKASELGDSAMEALTQNDSEARRLEQV